MTSTNQTPTDAAATTATEPTTTPATPARPAGSSRPAVGDSGRPHDDANRNSDDQGEQAEQGEEQEPGGNNEAAKYRRRLRDAEAKTAALTERLERMQSREAEQYADRLYQPADLHTFGPDITDLLNEEGDVDPERVRQAVADIIAARPGLGKPPQQRGPSPSGAGAMGARVGGGKGWSDVLRGT